MLGKRSSYNDIIMAYAPSEASDIASAGMTNYGFEQSSVPTALRDFPLDSCVSNPNYVGPAQSWSNLLPIDEVPEIIYAEQKGAPGQGAPPKPNRSMLWMKSKSLDDLCSKIGGKMIRKRRKPPPISHSQSMECLKGDYENVILPQSYNKMVRNTAMGEFVTDNPCLQRGQSFTDLLQQGENFPQAMSPSAYDMHLMAMQQHMQQQQLQQQHYLQQQQVAFQQHQAAMGQQQQQQQNSEHKQQHTFFPMALGRKGYESLCIIQPGGATLASTAPAVTLPQKDSTILQRYETMTLHKKPADDEVAL